MDQTKYSWDLDAILLNKSLDDLYQSWLDKMHKLSNLYNNIFDNEQNFINWLYECEEFEKISNRLHNYISNNKNEDLSNSLWNIWEQKIINNSIEFNKLISNYSNLILKNQKKIKLYLKNPSISDYKRQFDLIFKSKKHILSDKEEVILSQIHQFCGGFEDIYFVFTDNDLKFADAENSSGEIVKLNTQADVFKNLKSKDRKLRQTSWLSFYSAFYQFRNSLTKMLYYNYLMLNTVAKLKKFDDYIDSVCFDDEIDKKYILNIYEHIKSNSDLISKYRKYRNQYIKKILNINDDLMPWDANVDLIETNIEFDIEEIKQIAIDALGVFGDEYIKILSKAFEERWISFLPNPNKQTGAYSIGGIKGLTKYYISMNFDHTINSLYTLVHELGHSINSYYINQNQTIYVGNSIFYAEIASITNEMILSNYLLKKYHNDKKMKLMILDELISGFIATTSRQIIFSNFEWIANQWINQGSDFVYENIEKTYLELMKDYLGINNLDKYTSIPYLYSLVTPLRISHFYMGNFYVYKYAIGQIAAMIVSERIINNQSNMKELYFKFLSSGNSLNPIDTIKLLNIDFAKKSLWSEARNILTKWINEYCSLIDDLIKE